MLCKKNIEVIKTKKGIEKAKKENVKLVVEA
jgi:hypothetical protein